MKAWTVRFDAGTEDVVTAGSPQVPEVPVFVNLLRAYIYWFAQHYRRVDSRIRRVREPFNG